MPVKQFGSSELFQTQIFILDVQEISKDEKILPIADADLLWSVCGMISGGRETVAGKTAAENSKVGDTVIFNSAP